MRKLIVILLCLCGICASAQHADNSYNWVEGQVNDVVLMYYGQKLRKNWTMHQMSHFVTHTYQDGHTDWLFPAFLYLEFSIRDRDITFAPGYAKNAATKVEWQWLIERYFAKGEGLDALDKAIQNAKGKLGEPPFRHKVILGLPSPIKDQTDWGSTSRRLRFNKAQDRLEAMSWFIDILVARFNAAGYRNIDLDGLYWVDEDMIAGAELFPSLSNMVHQRGLKFYWIPYFTAPGRESWKQYGFDYAYLQPNYFFHLELPLSRIEDACSFARRYGTGLELEFDERYFSQRNTFGKRLKDYIDVYEKEGVFANSPIAYYCGNSAFLELSQSKEIQDVRLIDRMAGFISRRNEKLSATPSLYPSTPPSPTPAQPQEEKKSPQSLLQQYLNLLNPDYWHF